MTQSRVLVIVEVRIRHHPDFGSGFESVTYAKQQRLRRATSHFLMRQPAFAQWPCRFDVVCVSKRNYLSRIDWLPHAF